MGACDSKRTARRSRPSQAAKVWHVCRFAQRFELPDDARFCRRGPLVYSRDYVTANDDESASYLQQIDALSRRQNGLELEGAWSRIRRAASARSRAYRGYLLTADNRPASDAEIGRAVLFCEPRRATRILKSLAEVGLIEQARCPIFDLSQNDVTPTKRKNTPGNNANRKSGTSGRQKSVSQENSKKLVRARAPLRAKRKRNTEKEIEKKIRNPESAHLEGRTRAASPKANPQESAAKGASQATSGEAPRPVNQQADRPAERRDPRQIGNVLKFLHWQDAEAVQFGQDVFGILWPEKAGEPDSDVAKSERGTFTKWLWRQGPPGTRAAAIEKGLKLARHVGKNRRSYRKPGAAWLSLVTGKADPGAPKKLRAAV